MKRIFVVPSALICAMLLSSTAWAQSACVSIKFINCTISPVKFHWSGDGFSFDGSTLSSGNFQINGRDAKIHELITTFTNLSGNRCIVSATGNLNGEFIIKQSGWSDKSLTVYETSTQSVFHFEPSYFSISEKSPASLTVKIGCLG